jgi:integrase
MHIPKMRAHSSGQWRVTIDRKTHYLGAVKHEAEKRYRALVGEHLLPAGNYPEMPNSSVTVGELWRAFVKDQEATVSPRWWSKKKVQLAQAEEPLLALYEGLPVQAFGPRCFHEVRKRMATTKKRAKRSRGYVNELANKMQQAFRWGVGQEMVDPATVARLDAVPSLKPRELGLEDNERVEGVEWSLVEKTLEYLSERNADVIRLLWETAARPDELLRMQAGDIVDNVYRVRHHKTERWNKRRVIPLGPKAMAILEKYLKFRPSIENPTCKLFDWLEDSHTLYTAVRRACERGKLQHWFPYQLRHAALSRISLEHGKEIAQLIAGHSSAQMTDRYDHSGLAKAKMVAR